MANLKLTIQHNNVLYEPPVTDGVRLDWERTGSPGKLTFTVVKTDGLNFSEGDPVCFYYGNKSVFKGYVFKKRRDKEQHIEVTCYDQIRYLKNKYTYVFENKTATQIIKSLCKDFELITGTIDDTEYVIPAIVEENKAALDIILDVLEETLMNTGDMFVLYDDFGKLKVKNCADMTSTTLIMKDTAENFDYSSSIDNETYNSIVLYYKKENEAMQIYTASSPTTIKQWGLLRYFEKVNTPTSGQNKANSLLKLYNRKTRELKVSGAFGDITVRGGTLIPVRLDLGDVSTNNFMLVEKVTHNFENDHHTMDLTLEGYWEEDEYETVSQTVGGQTGSSSNGSNGSNGSNNGGTTTTTTTTGDTPTIKQVLFEVNIAPSSLDSLGNMYTVEYVHNGKRTIAVLRDKPVSLNCDANSEATVTVESNDSRIGELIKILGTVKSETSSKITYTMSDSVCVIVKWKAKRNIGGGSFGSPDQNVGGGSF